MLKNIQIFINNIHVRPDGNFVRLKDWDTIKGSGGPCGPPEPFIVFYSVSTWTVSPSEEALIWVIGLW